VDHLAQSVIFENLLESELTLLSKETFFLMTYFTSMQIYKNEFIRVKIYLTSKRDFFLMTCSTIMQIYKKSGCRKAFVSKVQTELINHSFKTLNVSRFRLTLNPLWNSITSPIWGVSFCMSTRSDIQVYRSPWRAPCPNLSSGEFILEVTISLSNQIVPRAISRSFSGIA
jgi:hypothetical protein